MPYPLKPSPGESAWFRDARFGMFIHWGLYALPARHEWVKSFEKTPEARYQRYFEHFDPDLYDPTDWARRARAAGMRYAVLTTKHHDGFCLFDSAFTDYKATKTPAGRDLVREYVDAFRREGLKIGFYYSLIDWHHPDFPIDVFHPRRDDPDALAQNEGRVMARYAEYLHSQIRELLTHYGKIDILWLDYSYEEQQTPEGRPWLRGKGPLDWESQKLLKMVRELQPGILINNRSGIEQDLYTPEQHQPRAWLTHPQTGEYVTWEACQTFSGSWGYHRDEMSWKNPEMLVRLLINTVSCGGNLLMNVGPTARGSFDERACEALSVFERFMKYNSRSIYGCTMAEPCFLAPEDCRLTQSNDGKRLYIHLLAYPFRHLYLPGMADKIEYAQFLHDGSEIDYDLGQIEQYGEGRLKEDKLVILKLPTLKPNSIVPVIEVFLK